MRALALQADGQQEQAARSLQDALERCVALSLVRSFLDEGPGVASLLRRMKDEGGRM
ncbi:MAG: hypothetical protein HGA45_36925, partial [Chloroflexales bacterium]|nr:hypothetical protein [Chloroflexales bacterium]